MRGWIIGVTFAAGVIAGCMAGGPPLTAQSPQPEPTSPLGSPFADRRSGFASIAYPLLLDRTDLRLGTTVQYTRIPSAGELHDLSQLPALQHVVMALPAWPPEYASLDVLNQLPEEADAIVVLPGYPPSRSAVDAWNLLNARLRIVIVVTEPPPSSVVVSDLNSMRSLERVIAQMDEPRRTGFERLQRPLSFRKLVE
jgi:hypothetical protein